jgi:hypothetical protein
VQPTIGQQSTGISLAYALHVSLQVFVAMKGYVPTIILECMDGREGMIAAKSSVTLLMENLLQQAMLNAMRVSSVIQKSRPPSPSLGERQPCQRSHYHG